MITISTEGGRGVRPLFIVNDDGLVFNKYHVLALMQGKLTWNNILSPNTISDPDLQYQFKDSVVEFLDVEELYTCMIAMGIKDLQQGERGEQLQIKYTNMEIHPSFS